MKTTSVRRTTISVFGISLKWKYLTLNNVISGEGTSSPVEQSSHVDEENDEFQIMLVKEEESEDDGSICTTTVCGKASTLALELNIILLFCPECHG